MGNDPDPIDMPSGHSSGSYALSGKIMLSAIVILFFVVVLMVFLHLYARWYLLQARRRHIRRRNRNRRTHLIFYVDPTAANPNPASVTRGLDSAVLKSLPVFTFSSETHPDPLECAVCLSEFEENESGRVLPKCNHSFHLDCIDMWFHSHSTCPLCRSPVEPGPVAANPVGVTINISDPGSSSGLCQHEDNQVGTSTSSFGARRKPMAIEVPRRSNDGFVDESIGCDRSFKSPMSRRLSFKRILSRDRSVDVTINISDPGSSSGLCTTCQHEDDQVGTSTSSFGARRKPMAIEVPRRNNDGFVDESIGCDRSFKSPMSRRLSFKRILSRDRSVDVTINISDPGSSSGLCTTCQHEDDQVGTSTSSFGARRKPMAIEVPRRNNDGFEDESIGCDLPASQSFKSPMNRILSFKKILSRDRRASPSPSSRNLAAASCGGSVSESDIERGREEKGLSERLEE